MNIKSFAGPAVATALLVAAAGCSSVPKTHFPAERTPEELEEQVLTSMACENGANGTATPLLCSHEGDGADPGLAPDPSDLRF